MENTPFFSVIMPVYKVERYLPAAIESVLAQTCPDFELILVDDCSPDGCPQICDAYRKRDKRIKVIHKPQNEGLGFARNTGMAAAKGNYLYFIDSDDTLQAEALATVQAALDADTEILVFGLNRVHEDEKGNITRTEHLNCKAARGYSVQDSGKLFLQLTEARVFPFAWNKVYKRAFVVQNEALFEKTKLIEDFLFNIYLFARAQRVTVIPALLYNYRKPAHQTLANLYAPEFYDLTKRKFYLETEFLEHTGTMDFAAKQTVLYSHIKHIVSVFLRNSGKNAGLSSRAQRQEIKRILNDETTVAVLRDYVPNSIKTKMLCFLLKNKMSNVCYFLVIAANFVKRG